MESSCKTLLFQLVDGDCDSVVSFDVIDMIDSSSTFITSVASVASFARRFTRDVSI